LEAAISLTGYREPAFIVGLGDRKKRFYFGCPEHKKSLLMRLLTHWQIHILHQKQKAVWFQEPHNYAVHGKKGEP
jgi:hypothetical protein